NAIAHELGYNDTKIGDLSDEDIDEIEEELKNPDLPEWLLNRRKDRETGDDEHLIESDLELKEEFDIRRLKGNRLLQGMETRNRSSCKRTEDQIQLQNRKQDRSRYSFN
ncbi:ribosomal protein S13P Rps13p, partial [Candidatus Haloredivivus sp. G17]